MTELPEDEWVVVFYPQTGALRLHPTVEAAKQHLSKYGFISHCYKSPKDFQTRHDHFALESFWRKIYDNATWRWPKEALGPKIAESDAAPPDCDTERFTHELWSFMQRVGDRVKKLSVAQTRSKDHYFLNLVRMRELISDEETFKKSYPKQCRVIINRLSKYETPYVLESELERMMLNLLATGQLKTKQDPWLIFQYYRVQLIKDGLVARGNEGQEESEDD